MIRYNQNYILLLAILIFCSCDYVSVLIVENQSTEAVKVKVEGSPIEVFGTMKLIDSKDDVYIYELQAQSEHLLIEHINTEINVENIPFQKLEISNSTDTICLKTRDEIFREMTFIDKNYFSIVIE